jgi:hypothetical protein
MTANIMRQALPDNRLMPTEYADRSRSLNRSHDLGSRRPGYPRTSNYSRASHISWVCKPIFDGSVYPQNLMKAIEYLPVLWYRTLAKYLDAAHTT